MKNNQNNDLDDNKLTNLDSITVIRNPASNIDLSIKKNIDDELDKITTIQSNIRILSESICWK